jgi:hypothetical protein
MSAMERLFEKSRVEIETRPDYFVDLQLDLKTTLTLAAQLATAIRNVNDGHARRVSYELMQLLVTKLDNAGLPNSARLVESLMPQ